MSRPPFIDTHVHFHDLAHPRLRWAWLEPDHPIDPVCGPDGAIRARRYWADDFIAESRFQNVEAVVHVQAATSSDDPVLETEWLEGFASRLGVPRGIVGYADLTQPDVADVLERHAAFPNFRGIRDIRYDGYLTDPAWLRGYALLERHGAILCDDPLLEQMPAARRLADRFPGITLCIDHAGYPRRRDADYFQQWRAGIRALAGAPNVVIKISGLGQADHSWTVESLRPWILECIDAFGVDRSFFGTNWPVDRLYSSYPDVLQAYDEITGDFSDADRLAMFAGNARRIFRLSEQAQ